jgi:hypothetical protein
MNEKLNELFSAYLDGRGTPEERKMVEQTIASDPAAREELEAMREFHADLQASKPADIPAPPEFRQNIMRRIQTQAGGDSAGSGGLGKGGFFNTTTSWVVMGIVLTGLVGTLVARDMKKEKHNSVEEQGAHAVDLTGLPETKMKTVAAQDIQAVQSRDEALGLQTGSKPMNGEVYISGSGQASKTGGIDLKGSSAESRDVALSKSAQTRGQLGLEDSGHWTSKQIQTRLDANAMTDSVQAGELVALAQKNNLHPGLLLAAKKQLPDKELSAMAGKIRNSLNQTIGQTEQKRLQAVINALDGKSEWVQKWQKMLQE